MSRPAIKVATIALIIGIAVMIVTMFVVIGFKKEITDRVTGFGAHLQIVNFENNNTYELTAIEIDSSLLKKLRSIDGVRDVTPFATKTGIIKTSNAFQGIVLRGLNISNHDTPFWTFFSRNMSSGHLPEKQGEVIISHLLSTKLMLGVDSTFLCYFISDNIRVRKYTVCGIYDTGFSDADEMFVIGNIEDVIRLNQWNKNEVSGVEILVDDFKHLEAVYNEVYFNVANRFDDKGNSYYVQNIIDLNPQIFGWLSLLDQNVIVIILLMLAVAGFNIISALIILILDNIQFIGIMKALGANNRFLRRVFLTEATMLIGKGLLWGNLLGIGLCAIQYFTHLIPLDASSYYVDFVPIYFHWGWWAIINVGTIVISLLILLAPSSIVANISPSQVMRYE